MLPVRLTGARQQLLALAASGHLFWPALSDPHGVHKNASKSSDKQFIMCTNHIQSLAIIAFVHEKLRFFSPREHSALRPDLGATALRPSLGVFSSLLPTNAALCELEVQMWRVQRWIEHRRESI